ncbi:hypothetical protein B0H10DRAFT_2062148 [Mycena sp. CBHHK59/15]|nr:hypothetical protein B0H10DRAFT_2062148 [Mycena sp. CBHHK59/15]
MSLRASTSTLNPSPSVRRSPAPPPLPSVSVVTSPPWARDEPPSPKEEVFTDTHHATESRPSVASFQSTYASNSPTTPRLRSSSSTSRPTYKSDRKSVSFKDRSISWLPTQRDGTAFSRKRQTRVNSINRDWNLSITLPTPPAASFTLQHNATPGWDVPWTSRVGAQGPPGRHHSEDSGGTDNDDSDLRTDPNKNTSVWRRRRKRLRAFILSNVYVPLLFRGINIAFTTTALAYRYRIRLLERACTPWVSWAVHRTTLVIIFAPPTLLEYFGRPLGLWRTSAKLAHTLFEVLFICAWSAALSLCCDNFFTSIIPCTPSSSISWYSSIPGLKSQYHPAAAMWSG